MNTHLRTSLLAGLAVLALAPAAVAGDDHFVNAELAAVRAATADFHRLSIAQGAGWSVLASGCVALPGVGGMGYHYLNPSLAGDDSVDPLLPEVLVYAPAPNGGRRLVAVEWIVFRHLQPNPPSLFGHTFHLNPRLGPQGAWILHAWVWHHNPSGMFADFNPRVSCEGQ